MSHDNPMNSLFYFFTPFPAFPHRGRRTYLPALRDKKGGIKLVVLKIVQKKSQKKEAVHL
jgi:hypothetical protein